MIPIRETEVIEIKQIIQRYIRYVNTYYIDGS